MPKFSLIVTCEHAGNKIPKAFEAPFAAVAQTLQSHRGYDLGAAGTATKLAKAFDAPLHLQPVSRLLVDNNRSLHHRSLFSEYSKQLSAEKKKQVLANHYHPHRRAVEEQIGGLLKRKPVLHLAVHSFTPVLAGEVRTCDIGLLYDPRREAEGEFAEAWRKGLAPRLPGFRVRKNYPYRGAADGFTTYLRRQFPRSYLGIELELNQKHVGTRNWSDLELALTATLAEFLQR